MWSSWSRGLESFQCTISWIRGHDTCVPCFPTVGISSGATCMTWLIPEANPTICAHSWWCSWTPCRRGRCNSISQFSSTVQLRLFTFHDMVEKRMVDSCGQRTCGQSLTSSQKSSRTGSRQWQGRRDAEPKWGRKKWEQGRNRREENNTLHVVFRFPTGTATTATTTTGAAAAAAAGATMRLQ